MDGGVLLVEAGQHRRIGCVGNERNGFRMRRVAEMAKKAGMMGMKRWRGRSVCLRTAETTNNKACEESDHDRTRSGDGYTRKGFGAGSSELVYDRARAGERGGGHGRPSSAWLPSLLVWALRTIG